jgi:hypothetical protein
MLFLKKAWMSLAVDKRDMVASGDMRGTGMERGRGKDFGL